MQSNPTAEQTEDLPEDFPHTAKEYTIKPLTEALIIGIGAFVVVMFTTYFIYHHALAAQKGEIREGIARTVTVLTKFVDKDLHKTFNSPDQESEMPYSLALEPLELALEADENITYLYTGILKDNKVFFILDPTPAGDADGDGVDDKAHIMDEYPEASEEMIRALKEQEVVVSKEPYTDRWGSFISAYAPMYDSYGEFVGVLGIDISAKNYFERLAPIKRATIRAMVAGFFVSFLVGALVWFMRNFARIINHSRLKMFEELKEHYQRKQS